MKQKYEIDIANYKEELASQEKKLCSLKEKIGTAKADHLTACKVLETGKYFTY